MADTRRRYITGRLVLFEGSARTRADYGQPLGGAPPVQVADAMPTAGAYVAGRFVRMGTPAPAPRLDAPHTGSSHKPGGDWPDV